MNTLGWRTLKKVLAPLLAVLLALAQGCAFAQSRSAYTQQELDQMLAPIALYADPLLAQILMASTYPLDVLEAARWSRAYPGLNGEDAVRAAADRDWDPSVKSLLAFPRVLERMDEQFEWTRRLGEAFLGQEPQVMDTIQNLRRRAQAAGMLQSDERQRVLASGPTLAIEPAQLQRVYVPWYDPFVVYGPWWWPTRPPVYWAPWPGHVVAHHAGLHTGFSWSAPIGLSVGFFFAALDWHGRHVRVVHVNNYTYRRPVVGNNAPLTHPGAEPGRWRHEPANRNRLAIAERDPASARQPERQTVLRAEPRRAAPAAAAIVPESRSAPLTLPGTKTRTPQAREDASAHRGEGRGERRGQDREHRHGQVDGARQPDNRPAAIANPVAPAPIREQRGTLVLSAPAAQAATQAAPQPLRAAPAQRKAEVRSHREAQARAESGSSAQPAGPREERREARDSVGGSRPAMDGRGRVRAR